MIYSANNFEINVYSKTGMSIKDTTSDIDISDSKWDFVFDFIIERTSHFYFMGERLEFSDDNFEEYFKLILEKEIIVDEDYQLNFFKIKYSNVMISRKLLSKFWSYYEYPSIIFLFDNKDEDEIKRLIIKKATYEEITGSIEKIYLIHRNFEPNVLWIKNSSNVPGIQVQR